MPQIKNGPKALNDLLEKVYKSCMNLNNDSTQCSKISWDAAKKIWKKDDKGNWVKK